MKDKIKPKYNAAQNVGWIVKIAWKVRKRVLFICVAMAALEVLYNLTQINRTRFLTFHAIFTIHPTFWAALYFGFILSFILPHLVSILYHKKTSPEDSGDELLILGDELHFWGFLRPVG